MKRRRRMMLGVSWCRRESWWMGPLVPLSLCPPGSGEAVGASRRQTGLKSPGWQSSQTQRGRGPQEGCVCSSTPMTPSHLEGGTERRQGNAWMRGRYLGGHERDVTARWTRRSQGLPAGEDSDQGRGPGKQRGKGPQVVQAFASVLYSAKQGAKLPNPPDQGTARGADGKASPSQSLRRSLERRSRTRRRHLTHTHWTQVTGY